MQGGSSMDGIETEIRELYSNLRDSVPTQSGGSSDQLRELFQEIGIPYTENLRDDIDNLVNGGYELNGGLNLQKLKSMLSDNEVAKIFYEDGSPKPYGIILGILFLISTIFGVRKSRQLTKTGEQLKQKEFDLGNVSTDLKNIKTDLKKILGEVKSEASELYKRVSLAVNSRLGNPNIIIDNAEYKNGVLDLMEKKIELEAKLKKAALKKEADIGMYKRLKQEEIEKLKNDLKIIFDKNAGKKDQYNKLIQFVENKENEDLFNEYRNLKDLDENKIDQKVKDKRDEFSKLRADLGTEYSKYNKIEKLKQELEDVQFIEKEFDTEKKKINDEIAKLDAEIEKLKIAPASGGHYFDLNFCISCLLYLIIFLLLFIVVASLTGNEKMTDYIQAGFG